MAAHTALRGIARPSTLSVAPSIPRLVSAASISSSTARCHDPRGPLGLYVLLRNGPEYKPSHLLVRAASGVTKEEVLNFKPAPRLEQIGDIHSKQMDDRNHHFG